MGTLSGGGTAVISIGERCLLGANAGLGISLGDDCIVEAGLYVTAGTRVTMPDGEVVKALELSGADNLLFRRNSQTGAVEAMPRSGSWAGLRNAAPALPPTTDAQEPAARSQSASVGTSASRRKPSPAGPKNEPGREHDAALEQLRGQLVGALAGVEPEEERRVAARVVDARRLEHRQQHVALGAVERADVLDVLLVAPGRDRGALDELLRARRRRWAGSA